MNTHYAMRGGPSHNGIYCGAFYIGVYAVDSHVFWYLGAALSFKLT